MQERRGAEENEPAAGCGWKEVGRRAQVGGRPAAGCGWKKAGRRVVVGKRPCGRPAVGRRPEEVRKEAGPRPGEKREEDERWMPGLCTFFAKSNTIVFLIPEKR